MRRIPFRWHELATVALTLSLAWGIRGQHGHERGGAVAGAMAGLAVGAVTGGAAWIGAAILGSLGFAIGGSLSYGHFIERAFHGSWEAVASLAVIGASWGGLGGLGLGLGLSFPRYRRRERWIIAVGLFLVWFSVDHLLWGRLSGPEDLRTRQWMAALLLAVFGILTAHAGIQKDFTSVKLAVGGAFGFGLGFPLAAWTQGIGQASGFPLDWWRTSEHLIGLCGGLSLGAAALSLEGSWRLPRAVPPWERWSAVVWLVFLLPAWLMANNLDYWISERALLPVAAGKIVFGLLLAWFLCLALWGWYEIRQGRMFVTSWMPRHLRRLFLVFLWTATGIASMKTLLAGQESPTPAGFLILALAVTILIQFYRPKTSL